MNSEEYDVVAEANLILGAADLAEAFRGTLEESFVKAATQIHEHIGRKLTQEEAEGILDDVTHCIAVHATWSAWKRGDIAMVGFDGEEILWGPA